MTSTAESVPNIEPAVVFVPMSEGEISPLWVSQCIAHCTRHGYRFVGIVRTYREGLLMLANQQARVLVCARRDHVDPRNLPRVEFVGEDTRRITRQQKPSPGEQPPTPHSPDRNRRPRQLRDKK